MKLAFGMIVFEGDYVLRECLESVYPYATQILIAEGPVKYWQSQGRISSTDNTNDILDNFPDPENKIKVIHSHINTKKFYPRDRNRLKEKYGYQNKKIIFYYGAMWENKGTDILIKGIPLLLRENHNTLFIFAPRNMPYAKKYEPALKKFEKSVEILDGDLNIPEYVSMADLVVLPYPTLVGTEGNPSCLLEAMACKTPVVTTSLPELKEIVNGCVVMAKPGDVNSLIEKVNYVLKNNPTKMIERAYEKSKEFSVEKITEQFLELYKN